MHRKNLLLLFVLIVLIGVFVYPQLTGGSGSNSAEAVDVSAVTAAPQQYLGQLTISGAVGALYAEEGVIVMVDEGGCCNIPILVPLSQEQQNLLSEAIKMDVNVLYSGALPQIGDFIEATGTWTFENGVYDLEIETVARNGEVIISRVN